MSIRRLAMTVLLMCLAALASVTASGRVGLYGIIEKVVFEPNEQAPQRLQLWGVFAYADGAESNPNGASAASRGYLYFKLPDPPDSTVTAVKREWMDLKAVAGTGQAIAFGTWAYNGQFDALNPATRTEAILEMYPGRRVQTDLRVRLATERPASPATYQTNVGIVKPAGRGSHAAIVEKLTARLRTP